MSSDTPLPRAQNRITSWSDEMAARFPNFSWPRVVGLERPPGERGWFTLQRYTPERWADAVFGREPKGL